MDEIDALLSSLDAVIETALDEAAEKAVQYAASLTKGALAESITFRRKGQFGREIYSTKDYARFVENGRPGFSARGAKALRFIVNGKVVFAKSVGPQKAKPFMKPAKVVLEQAAASRLAKALQGKVS